MQMRWRHVLHVRLSLRMTNALPGGMMFLRQDDALCRKFGATLAVEAREALGVELLALGAEHLALQRLLALCRRQPDAQGGRQSPEHLGRNLLL